MTIQEKKKVVGLVDMSHNQVIFFEKKETDFWFVSSAIPLSYPIEWKFLCDDIHQQFKAGFF